MNGLGTSVLCPDCRGTLKLSPVQPQWSRDLKLPPHKYAAGQSATAKGVRTTYRRGLIVDA